MPGQWIKLESETAQKPEVLKLARLTGLHRDAVLGKLIRLWIWFDANTEDGTVSDSVDADVDALVDADGFADALKRVGWLQSDPEKEIVTLPNFERHNGESAKKRAQKNRRMANWRQSSTGASTRASTPASTEPSTDVDANRTTSASTREEKRREEKNNTPCSPPSGDGDKGVLPDVAADGSDLGELRERVCRMFGHSGSLPKDRKVNGAWNDLVGRCAISEADVELLEWWYGNKKNPPPRLKGRYWTRTSVLTLLRNWERDLAFVRNVCEEFGGADEVEREEEDDEEDDIQAKLYGGAY